MMVAIQKKPHTDHSLLTGAGFRSDIYTHAFLPSDNVPRIEPYVVGEGSWECPFETVSK